MLISEVYRPEVIRNQFSPKDWSIARTFLTAIGTAFLDKHFLSSFPSFRPKVARAREFVFTKPHGLYGKREWIRYFTFFFEKRQNGIESIFIHVPAWFSSHSTMIGNAFFSTKKGANFRLFMTLIGFVFSLHFGCDRKRKFYC